MSVRIAPSVLSTDLGLLREQVAAAEAGGADWLHVDVMDGHFVPNLTFGAPMLRALRKISTLPLDVHLMVEHPERYIDEYAELGAAVFAFHPESTTHVQRHLARIREKGMQAGLGAEAKAFGELVVSGEARELMGIFFAQQELKKDRGVADATVEARKVRRVGVLGAGLMGAGVAYVTAITAKLSVRLKDRDDRSLGRGFAYIRELVDGRAKSRRMRSMKRPGLAGSMYPASTTADSRWPMKPSMSAFVAVLFGFRAGTPSVRLVSLLPAASRSHRKMSR